LREKYVEYAHRVHVELTARAARLHEIVADQEAQTEGVQAELEKAAMQAAALEGRVAAALAKHEEL
jgi:hypothetical protein